MSNSGWTNDAVDTLTVPTGATTGERVIIANQSNGDAIDIYNSANKLVFSIDSTGRLVAVSSISNAEAVINGGTLFFEDSAQNPNFPQLVNGSTTPDNCTLNLFGGRPQHYAGVGQGAFVALSTGDTPASEWINTEQRGIQGAMVQTDISTNANQLVLAASFSGTTDVNGHILVTHNFSVTPSVVVVTGTTPGGTFANLTYGVNAKTATQVDVSWKVANTGAAFANSFITFDAVMFG